MIKIGIRNNLFYPLMLIIFTLFRKINSILMKKMFDFDGSLILTLIMFLSEFLFGLFLFIRHIQFVSRKRYSKVIMGIKLIQALDEISHPDSNIKIYILIFLSTFFDFSEFILITYYFPKEIGRKNISISVSLDIRLKCLTAFFLAFFCYFLLKYKILRHQVFSLIIIFICLIIIIILEYFVNDKNEGDIIDFSFILLIIFLYNFFVSLNDIIGKYLLEFNYVNPFKMLMLEGIIGFILSVIYFLIINFENPFEEFTELKDNSIYFLIIFLILYFIFSGFKNIYRISTINLFSPMARTLTDTFIDPLYITYYYFFENDFKIKEKQKLYYFLSNLILSIIIVFCGFIYNEIFVFFCCNLERETYNEVSNRAKILDRVSDTSMDETKDNIDS